MCSDLAVTKGMNRRLGMGCLLPIFPTALKRPTRHRLIAPRAKESSGKEVRIIAEVEAVIGNMDGVNTIRHINRTE